jgi:hypothetical protein
LKTPKHTNVNTAALRKTAAKRNRPATSADPTDGKAWEMPSGEGLAEFAIHAGFVASLLMASSAVGTSGAGTELRKKFGPATDSEGHGGGHNPFEGRRNGK